MEKKMILVIMIFFMIVSVASCYITLTLTPIILKDTTFTYQLGKEISDDPSDYVKANEGALENVSLDLSKVNQDEVGEYEASLLYNEESYPFTIKIVDTIAPKGTLVQSSWDIVLGGSLNASDLIEKVVDYSDYTIYFEENDDHQRVESITFDEAGSYLERIIIVDAYDNESTTYRVIVNVAEGYGYATIEGVYDVIISAGEDFDLMDGVTGYDLIDGDLTDKIEVSGEIGEEPGDYTITYSLTNSRNRETTVERIITVE